MKQKILQCFVMQADKNFIVDLIGYTTPVSS